MTQTDLALVMRAVAAAADERDIDCTRQVEAFPPGHFDLARKTVLWLLSQTDGLTKNVRTRFGIAAFQEADSIVRFVHNMNSAGHATNIEEALASQGINAYIGSCITTQEECVIWIDATSGQGHSAFIPEDCREVSFDIDAVRGTEIPPPQAGPVSGRGKGPVAALR